MTCAACHAPMGGDARFCPTCGAPVSAPGVAREARKNVAILFMDLVGSTTLAESLDPEPLRQIMDRYFAAASSAIAAHGGAVEKFIGDAVMAVFGATISHEDDALRAVRAAVEAVGQLAELSAGLAATHKVTLEIRCGICSGEVIAITNQAGDFRVIGDPVNTAARLQTAAGPGEILVDTASASMVRTSIGLEPVPPLQLRGKAQPVPAWRVTGGEPSAEPAASQPNVPLIGRRDELDELRSAFRRVTKRNQLCLVTLLGAPGIGKSRLVRDFVGSVGADEVSVLTGKCSAYGRGITYKPLAEMLGASGWPEQARAMETDGGDAARAAKSLSSIMGASAPIGTESAGIEEISWAVRYLLGQLGKKRPVIMIWEDLHWAESTLLDLIDDVVSWLTDVPVLLLCVSRTELLDIRPTWGGGKPSAMTLEIPPLSPAESAELVAEIAASEEVSAHQAEALCERVAAECEGNPLFAELMLDVCAETAPGAKLPPTITALLTARLDQLPHDERELLEVASAIGRDFTGAALSALLAAGDAAGTSDLELLDRLVKRRIITRVRTGSFRFGQALMRDIAYQLSSKTRRERWHLLLADQLAHLAADSGNYSLAEDRMALACHVESASLLQRELRPGDAGLPRLAAQAAAILIGEGTTALRRRDLPSAAVLFDRGRALVPADDEQQVPLMLYISDCWLRLSDATRALAATAVRAESAGTGIIDFIGQIQRCIVELRLGLSSCEEIAVRADQLAGALPGHEPADRAWCRLHQLRAYLQLAAEASAKAEAEFRLALDRTRSLQDSYETDQILGAICELAQWTPAPVGASLKLCAEMSERFATNRALLVPVLLTRARLAAVAGDLADARVALAAAKEYTTDLHLDVAEAMVMAASGLIESLSGDHRNAEASYRRGQALLLQMGRSSDAMMYEAYAARELFEQGNMPGAEQAADQLALGGAAMDLRTKVIVSALAARIAAASGRSAQAVELAADGAALSEETDDLCLQGDCYTDLAIVAAAARQQAAAADAAATALDRYQAKGASMLAARAQRLIATGG
jgi:class 3 adenylate cyclase